MIQLWVLLIQLQYSRNYLNIYKNMPGWPSIFFFRSADRPTKAAPTQNNFMKKFFLIFIIFSTKVSLFPRVNWKKKYLYLKSLVELQQAFNYFKDMTLFLNINKDIDYWCTTARKQYIYVHFFLHNTWLIQPDWQNIYRLLHFTITS